jgi:hypothetical protein
MWKDGTVYYEGKKESTEPLDKGESGSEFYKGEPLDTGEPLDKGESGSELLLIVHYSTMSISFYHSKKKVIVWQCKNRESHDGVFRILGACMLHSSQENTLV